MESRVIRDILVTGTGKLASGVAITFAKYATQVQFASDNRTADREYVEEYIADCKRYSNVYIDANKISYTSLEDCANVNLVICITAEDILIKQQKVQLLDQLYGEEIMIAVNTESFSLDELQKDTRYPHRIIGINWSDPAYTTSFLEIIGNKSTPSEIIRSVEYTAINYWEKDPYIVDCGYSVKARFMAALAREAFYLVENGYASVEDIDRACRNDAGYYLPFSGNCRYMDLMGTYAYGLVMKDLNRELSKADAPPAFFTQLLSENKTGMETEGGFYRYIKESVEEWEEKFREFSFEIKAIIDKYPFNYLEEDNVKVKAKISQDE